MMFSVFGRLLGLTMLCSISPYSAAQAVEIYRNSKAYEIDVQTPAGVRFERSGVDRVFSVEETDVNLRLIQDSYDNCRDLVEERKANWRKHGYTLAQGGTLSRIFCSVTLKNPSNGRMMSSNYLWLDACNCFAALHFRYPARAVTRMEKLATPIIASLRKGSGSPSVQSLSRGHTAGSTIVRFSCDPNNKPRGLCALIDPRTNKPFQGETSDTLYLTKKQMQQLPQLYAELERADAILRKRGMSSANRRYVMKGLSSQYKDNAGYGASQLYFSNVFKAADERNTYDSERLWRRPATILMQYASYFPHYYDPISGREVDRSSVVSLARDLPTCFLKGDPERDCKPLRYHWWVGCWIRPQDRSKVVRDPGLWRMDILGDIPMIPVAVAYKPFDLSKAGRSDRHLSRRPTGKADTAGNDNPARRMACSSIDVWEGLEEDN